MATNSSNSALANMIAQRARLSAVRQRIGLEGTNNVPQGNVQPIQPNNGPPPKAVVGPQAQAAMGPDLGGVQLRPPPTEAPAGPPAIPPDTRARMQEMASGFMQQYGDQQRQLLNQPQQAQAPSQPAPASAGGQVPPGAPAGAGMALKPIAQFVKATGRLPNPQELLVLGARTNLQAHLGRPPTPDEIKLYLTQPGGAPPGATNTPGAPAGGQTP